jgi:hypothetical protein
MKENDNSNIVYFIGLKYPNLLFIFLILIFSINNLFSQSAGGGYSESYLLRDVGARPIAMAGAYVAISNEPMCLFYNPSGLSTLTEKPTFNSSYSFLEFGRTQSALAWGQEIAQNVGLGLAINNYTTGSFTARDANGNSIGSMTDWQFEVIGGAAYNIDFASIGVGVKYLSDALMGSGTKASGFGVDLGTKFNVMDMFTFGVAVQNVTGLMYWNTQSKEKDILPYTIRTGFGFEIGLNEQSYTSRSTISGELEQVNIPATRYILIGIDGVLTQHENAPSLLLGVEAALHEVLAFRGGIELAGDDLNKYKLFPMNIWGAGVSLRPRKEDIDLPFRMNIDYSISTDKLSINQVSQHVSLMLEF